MTPTGDWRLSILRFFWDGENELLIEVHVGDLFANGWGGFAHVNSLAVRVNPGSGFNCYWPMPFRRDLGVTIQALGWQSGGRYLPLQDDISSVAFWHQ